MQKIEIILLVTVVEVGDLTGFNVDELSEFWAAFTLCRNDENFFAEFSAKEQKSIIDALQKVEHELRKRHKEPVNFFQLMQDNPAKVEFYLKKFSLSQLLTLERDLCDFSASEIVADFLKLVKKQIYKLIPVS